MTLEKRIIEVSDYSSEEWLTSKQQEVFVETKMITEEVIWHIDSIESMITQKQNTIENLQAEIVELQAKLSEINALTKKK